YRGLHYRIFISLIDMDRNQEAIFPNKIVLVTTPFPRWVSDILGMPRFPFSLYHFFFSTLMEIKHAFAFLRSNALIDFFIMVCGTISKKAQFGNNNAPNALA